ncbi:MAG: VanZ family protein [Saccharofermentans sp.]|nr:VanZ family protein [Saccharofermentans sp.]
MNKHKELKTSDFSVGYTIMAIVYWVLSLATVLVIWQLSADDADASANFTTGIITIINNVFDLAIDDDEVLRLAGHIGEFALLTLFTFLAMDSTNKISDKTSYSESPMKILRSDNEMNITVTMWFCLLNAILDEYHQLFISGRDGSILDVGIDCIGIFVVLIIARLVFSINLRVRGKKEVIYNV